MLEARVVRVLIVSPGDVAPLRDLAARAVWDWNSAGHLERSGVVAVPVRWEYDAASRQSPDGSDGQALLNAQIVDDADIVVAVFHTRLGTATPRARSGSAEEIERARPSNLGTHVFVSDAPVPRSMSPEQRAQLDALETYERELQGRGLVGHFTTDVELERQIRVALDRDIDQLAVDDRAARPARRTPPSAWLQRMGPLEQLLPGGPMQQIGERVARSVERQGGVVATSIEDTMTLRPSADARYIRYDIHRRVSYVWSGQPARAAAEFRIAPVLAPRPGSQLPPTPAPSSDRNRQPWAFQYWPQMEDPGDWESFKADVDVTCSLAQTRDQGAVKPIKLRRAGGASSTGGSGASGPDTPAPLAPVRFSFTVDLTEEWDTVEYRVRNLVHPLAKRAMLFYAGDFCTGAWDLAVTSSHPAITARTVMVAGADMQMSSRRPTADLMYGRIRATDVAIFPGDAMIVSLDTRP